MAYLSERPLALQQQIFAKLFEAAQVAAMTEEEQEQYFAQMLTERDRVSQMKTATRIGIEKGLAQGIAQGESNARASIAKNMKDKGLDPTTISEYTGLSIEEIARL